MKLYTPLINKALKLAYDAHHGQFDKSGVPYIYHPAYLAAQMDTEEEIVIALLHDVVEDTFVTLEDLEREGFPPVVIKAVERLTRKEEGNYSLYISEIGNNLLASKVKMADLLHNSNPSRNANLPPEDAVRYMEKYTKAIKQLEECMEHTGKMLKDADNGDPLALFWVATDYYFGRHDTPDRQKAFELLSRAMETGLPEDEEYHSHHFSELNAARFLVPVLLRDDDGVLSEHEGSFWFEKPLEPLNETQKSSTITPSFHRGNLDINLYEKIHMVREKLRKIYLYITGLSGVERNLRKAADIAQDIVLELSFGDRDHDPAITLRSILQDAVDEESRKGKVSLNDW